MYEKILTLLKVGTPSVDTFAQTGEHHVPRFWGPGGEKPDAFSEPWDRETLLWASPPYSRLAECVQKIKSDQPTMVLVVPDWRRARWWKDLQNFVTRAQFFPKGTPVFQLHGRVEKPVKWGVWAYLIDPKEKFSRAPGVLNDPILTRVTGVGEQPSLARQPEARRTDRHTDFDRTKHWKVLSWNVNGLRALNRKQWLRDVIAEETPDVLCLQEIKLRSRGHHKVATIPGYVMFTSLCATREGYSGTRTYVRPDIVQYVQFGLPGVDSTADEGRVVTVELHDCFGV